MSEVITVLNTSEVQQAQDCSQLTTHSERSELWAKVFEKRANVFMRVPYNQGRSPSYVNQGILFVMKFLAIILPHESSKHCKIEIFSNHFSQ